MLLILPCCSAAAAKDSMVAFGKSVWPTRINPNLTLYFSGGIRHHQADYSGGVRQALHNLTRNSTGWEDIMMVEGK